MAKGFPYFKFVATEWLTGDIVFEDYELQGIFINVCAIYWHRNGDLTMDELQKRLKTDRLNSLCPRFFSVIDNKIIISFLDEQLLTTKHISKVNSENGKLGGRPKILEEKPNAKRPLTDRKAKKSKEEEEEEYKEIYKEKVKHAFDKSPIFDKNKFAEQFSKWSKEEMKYYYDSAMDYSEAKGARYKDWVAAVRGWHRKDKAEAKGYFHRLNQQKDIRSSDSNQHNGKPIIW